MKNLKRLILILILLVRLATSLTNLADDWRGSDQSRGEQRSYTLLLAT